MGVLRTGDNILCGIEKWLPVNPTDPVAVVLKLLRRTYFVLMGDSASSNELLKGYLDVSKVAKTTLKNDRCRCHRLNSSNHDQLQALMPLDSLDKEAAGGALVAVAPPVAVAVVAKPKGQSQGKG